MQNPSLLSSVGEMEAEQLLHHTSVPFPASLSLLLSDACSLAPMSFPIKKDHSAQLSGLCCMMNTSPK